MKLSRLSLLTKKVISIFCAIMIVVGCIPSLGVLGALTSDDGVTVYDFESDSGTHVGKDETFTTEDGTKLYYLTNTLTPNNKMCDIIEEDDGNKVLKVYNSKTFSSTPTPQNIQNNTIYPQILLNDKNGVYELEAGKQYVISFRYKVTASCSYSNAWAKPSFMTLTKGVRSDSSRRIYSTATVFENTVDNTNKKENYKVIENFYGANPTITQWDGTNTGTNPVALGEWQTFTCSFTGMDKTVFSNGTTLYPYLGLYMTLAPGAEIRFDDFEICTKSTITFNANGGSINGNPSVDISGDIGKEFSVGKPERKGYTFAGWFSDSDCTVPVSSKVFPAQKSVIYYAGWKQGDIKRFDFEPTLDGTNTVVSGSLGNGLRVTSYDTTETSNHNVWSIKKESDGNNVLAINYNARNTGSAEYQPGVLLLNDGMSAYSVIPGEKYILTFRYKIVNAGTKNEAWLYLSQSPTTGSGVWGNLKSAYNAFGGAHNTDESNSNRVLGAFNNDKLSGTYKDLNGTEVSVGNWYTFSYSFTAKDYGNGNYIGFATCAIPNLELYIDDVTITNASTEPATKVIAFETNGGSAVKSIVGLDGNAIVMPDKPIKDGYAFSGWYTDKEFTKKFTAKNYSDLSSDWTILYAKWELPIISGYEIFDFEDASGTITSGSINNTPISSFDDASGKNIFSIKEESDGNKVLEISHPQGYSANYKNGTYILNKEGRLPELKDGEKYTVRMRVKINSKQTAEATARVVLTEDIIVGNTGMADEFGVVLGDSSAFVDKYTAKSRLTKEYMLIQDFTKYTTTPKDVNNNTVKLGEWHTITKTFTAYPSKTNGNLYIGLTACTGVGLSVYIDDIEFIHSSEKAIFFNSNGGEHIKSVIVKEGESITLPTSFREGYVFEGWYTDSEFKNKASETLVMGKENITLYAKWKNTQHMLIDFENAYSEDRTNVTGWSSFGGAFFLNRVGQKSHGVVAEFDQNGCFSGSSSMLIKYSATKDYSSLLLRNSANLNGFTAEPGEKFRITFRYKAASGDISGAQLMVSEASSVKAGWYKVTHYTDGRTYLNGERANATWQTGTIIYKNETDAAQYLHLGVDVSAAHDANASVYVDNIYFERLDSDKVVVKVDYQDGFNTNYYVGIKGSPLSIAAPSARDGFNFKYWSTDKKGDKKFTATTFPSSDTNVYAIWQMVKVSTGFENYPDAWNWKGNAQNMNTRLTRFADLSSTIVYSGSKSMHIKVDEKLKPTDYTYVALDYNFNNLTLQNNSRYLVTFYYYAETVLSDLNVYLSSANGNNIWSNTKQYTDNTFIIKKSDVGKGWQKGTILLNTEFKADSANAIYLLTSGYTNPTSIYFDNVTIESIADTQSVITFVRGDGKSNEYSIKNIGTAISFPDLGEREYYYFSGWYKDPTFKTEFTGAAHTADDMVIYAKWDFKPGVKINVDFENYNLNLPENTSVTSKDKSGGNKSLYFDCGEKGSTLPIPINLEDDVMTVSNGQRFAISFDYKLNSAPIDSAYQLSLSMFTAKLGYVSPVQQKFKYNHTSQGSMRHWIRTTAEIDVWQQFSDTITIENSNNSNIMYFVLHQGNTMSGYIDNITLTPLASDDIVVTTDKFTTDGKPYYIGKKGQSYTLDNNIKRPGNFAFIGWFADKHFEKEISTAEFDIDTRVFASWGLRETIQGFENFDGIPGIKMIGSDYELYNSSVSGFDKSNVYNGKVSLHRKGESHLWQNAQILTNKTVLGTGSGAKYTVEFWVKMDSSLHTDGAIKIACGSSINYPYAISGEYYNVITIDELSDKEWHKVSYTFDSLTGYFVIRTPGYCSLYFDDIKLTFAGKNAEISKPVTVSKEYEPQKRNSDGSIIEESEKIIDDSLVSHKIDASKTSVFNNLSNTAKIIFGCSGVVLIAAAVIVFIILKRKGKIIIGRKSS